MSILCKCLIFQLDALKLSSAIRTKIRTVCTARVLRLAICEVGRLSFCTKRGSCRYTRQLISCYSELIKGNVPTFLTRRETQQMGYEIYAKEFPTKSTSPTLTISKLGRCGLNRAAAMQFDKEAVENVLLLWDRDALKFAIRPITKKDSRSFNVRYMRKGKGDKEKIVTGAALSAVMFLKHIGYDLSSSQTYPIHWNADEAIFEIQLSKERFGVKESTVIPMEGGKKHGRAANG